MHLEVVAKLFSRLSSRTNAVIPNLFRDPVVMGLHYHGVLKQSSIKLEDMVQNDR